MSELEGTSASATRVSDATREHPAGAGQWDDLDPSRFRDLDLGDEAIRQNFTTAVAEWATWPPFYVMVDGKPNVICARYDDAMEVLLDRERFSVEPPQGPGNEKFDKFMGVRTLAQIDGEGHDRLRRLVNPAFTLGAVKRIEDEITAHIDEMLDAIEAKRSRFDAMAEFSSQLMVRTLLRVLFRLDEGQERVFVAMSHALPLIMQIPPGGTYPEAFVEAFEEAKATIEAMLAERRERPRDDLMTQLIRARDEGDMLTETELFDQIFTICVAALTSTASAMGGVLLMLCRHPEQFDRVKADAELIPNAVQESLRVHGASFLTFTRFAVQDTEVGGTRIPAGMPVRVSQQGACYDPDKFPDPLRFDIDREEARSAPVFGAGMHHCLGNRLARRVLEIALGRFVARFPDARLADDDFVPQYHGQLGETLLVELPMRAA